jgi:hypothetical protein
MDKYPGLCSIMTGSIFAGNICSVIHLIDQSTWLTLARPLVGSSSPRTCILLEFQQLQARCPSGSGSIDLGTGIVLAVCWKRYAENSKNEVATLVWQPWGSMIKVGGSRFSATGQQWRKLLERGVIGSNWYQESILSSFDLLWPQKCMWMIFCSPTAIAWAQHWEDPIGAHSRGILLDYSTFRRDIQHLLDN